MINKIVVMAAGKGTRMLELSESQPKHLIDVSAKPFLYYALSNIKKAGFKKIILVIGYRKEKMGEFAEKYKDEFNLQLIDQFKILGKDKYGTACPVECTEKIIGQEDFVVANGDDLYSPRDLKTIRELDTGYSYAAGFESDHPEYYGILKIDNEGFLEKIIEKPQPGIDFDQAKPFECLINIGLYKFTPDIFEALKKIELSPRGEYELTDALTLLATKAY